MSSREFQRAAFAAQHGLEDVPVTPLAADASFRRYFRYHSTPQSVLLMDAPPPQEDVRPFVRMAEHLLTLGLSAPSILARDEAQGFLVLEDFGEDTYTRLIGAGEDDGPLYELAVDALIHLHAHPHAANVAVPAYDQSVLLREVALFTQWYLPYALAEPLTGQEMASWLDAWRQTLARRRPLAPTLVLRDYHVDNLMRLDARAGVGACGLLDFQDALIGPGAYDLVSLTEDARRDVDDHLRDRLLNRYLAAFPTLDGHEFMRWYGVLGAQRHAKVLGIFVRLYQRDGKDIYLRHLPRVLRLLRRALVGPELTSVRQWMAQHVDDRLAAALSTT